jgi:predicted MFS family arabinose efflux permease
LCLVVLVVLGVLGEPTGSVPVVLVGLLLGIFMFSHAFGPGAQGMTMATLSYPTSLRGTGAGFGQAALRIGSTMALVLFPVLTDKLGTGVFFVVAIAPLAALVTLLAIRWDPVGRDVDVDDFDDSDDSDDTARPSEPVRA